MADGAEVVKSIGRYLEYDRLTLGDLPEVAEDWTTLSEGERVSWSLSWDQVMGSDLPFLETQYRSGVITKAQQSEYRKLLKEIKEHLPLIERLGLYPPRVPLEV